MQFAPKADPSEPAMIWLERERRIPVDVASKFGVMTLHGHLTFEFFRNGALQYRKSRIVAADGGKSFRRDRKDVPSCLFNEDCLHDVSKPDDVLIITEGEIDCLSFLTIGCPFVVSVPDGAQFQKPGEGDINPEADKAFGWLWAGKKLRPEIAKFGRVLLAVDDDDKGRILRDELAVRIGRAKCWHIKFPEGCKDANDVLVKYDEDALIDAFTAIQPMVSSRLVPFSSIPKQGYLESYTSGWPGLDKHLRIVPPELITVTGQPGSGKSLFTLSLVANLAKNHGLRGAIMQLEDNVERNRADLLWFAKRNVEGVGDSDVRASQWVDRFFLTISPSEDEDPNNDYTLKWLRESIEEAATRHRCRWIVIDPWNEIEHVWAKGLNEASYTNDALRSVKRLSRRYQMAVIIVTHPSKEGGKLKDIADMSLYDVSGSSSWKNKSDHGIIVHRDMDAKVTWIKIDKSKNHTVMGIPGTVKMRYDFRIGTYEFLEGDSNVRD